ncbi:MAG: hypothetical protein HUU38_30350, partial [Anaerolineales bacterium]|nr:hypothetical protein [Anaerolineales bacterium]
RLAHLYLEARFTFPGLFSAATRPTNCQCTVENGGLGVAFAWPLTLTMLLFTLKKPLFKLLGGVKRFRYGDLEAEFGETVQQLEQQAQEAELPSTESIKTASQPERTSSLYRLAEISPRAAITEAWILVEDELYKASTRLRLDLPFRTPPIRIVQEMEKQQLIHYKLASTIDKLRRLRNTAAHEKDFDIKTDDVIDYINLSIRSGEAVSILVKAHTLVEWLYKLDENQFQNLLNNLLSPAEQDSITSPISRESFINDMRLFGKLDSVEKFLLQTYPDLFTGFNMKAAS